MKRHHHLFQAAAARYANELALTDDSRSATYSELARLVEVERTRLSSSGINLYSRVLLEAENDIESVARLIALWGQVADVILAPEGMRDHSESCGATHIATRKSILKVGSHLEESNGHKESWQFFFTSGTSGTPKVVVHTTKTLLSGLRQTIDVQREALGESMMSAELDSGSLAHSRLGLVLLTHMPIWSIAGFTVIQRGLLAGEHVVLCENQSPAHIVSQCQAYGVSNLSLNPFTAQQICRLDSVGNLQCILIGVGGSSVSPQLVEALEARSGCPVLVGYGSTETAGPVVMNRIGDPLELRTTTIGRALPGVSLAVLQGPELPLRHRTTGELAIESDSLMVGYWSQDGRVARESGAFLTGDLVSIDPDGYVTIHGRTDLVILRGGRRIDPTEIELVAKAYPDVIDAAVFGAQSRVSGQQDIIALVVAENRVSASELKRRFQEALPPYKVPRKIRVVDNIPRSRSGKLNVADLASRFGV